MNGKTMIDEVRALLAAPRSFELPRERVRGVASVLAGGRGVKSVLAGGRGVKSVLAGGARVWNTETDPTPPPRAPRAAEIEVAAPAPSQRRIGFGPLVSGSVEYNALVGARSAEKESLARPSRGFLWVRSNGKLMKHGAADVWVDKQPQKAAERMFRWFIETYPGAFEKGKEIEGRRLSQALGLERADLRDKLEFEADERADLAGVVGDVRSKAPDTQPEYYWEARGALARHLRVVYAPEARRKNEVDWRRLAHRTAEKALSEADPRDYLFALSIRVVPESDRELITPETAALRGKVFQVRWEVDGPRSAATLAQSLHKVVVARLVPQRPRADEGRKTVDARTGGGRTREARMQKMGGIAEAFYLDRETE